MSKIFQCGTCGNVVELVVDKGGPMACCGARMQELTANTVDAAQEKHVPVIEKIDGGYRVSVGSVAHPMEDKHYIAWIELNAGAITVRKRLNPGEEPVAEFLCPAPNVTAREYCNLHGLWEAKN